MQKTRQQFIIERLRDERDVYRNRFLQYKHSNNVDTIRKEMYNDLQNQFGPILEGLHSTIESVTENRDIEKCISNIKILTESIMGVLSDHNIEDSEL